VSRLALLVGLFIIPTILLALGHRLRDRSVVGRGAFWGGVIGHTLALVVGTLALHYPPVLWSGTTREVLAFWIMMLGGVAGMALGAVRGSRRTA
jgi:hypothetical protein